MTSTGYTISKFYNNNAAGGKTILVSAPHDEAVMKDKTAYTLKHPFALPVYRSSRLTLTVSIETSGRYNVSNTISIWEEEIGDKKYLKSEAYSPNFNSGNPVTNSIYLENIGPKLQLTFEAASGGLVIIGTADTIGDPGMNLPVIEKLFVPSIAQVIEIEKTGEPEIFDLMVDMNNGHGSISIFSGHMTGVFPLSIPVGRAAAHELVFTNTPRLDHDRMYLWQERDNDAGGAYVLRAACSKEPLYNEVVQSIALDARWRFLELKFGYSMGNGNGSSIVIEQLKGH